MSAAEDVLKSMLELKDVIQEITLERMEQITREGYSLVHDDEHVEGELAGAAAAYALAAACQASGVADAMIRSAPPPMWPDGWGRWNPKDARRNLITAGALIFAELQRLQRAKVPG